MSADRNLLFGILALQLDFITRDELIAGMQAWVNDKAKPLAEILQSSGALSATNRQLLEPLVARHIEQHDNDPQKSLAALSSLGNTTAQQLASLVDPDVTASLPFVGAARPLEPESTVTAGQSTSAGGRFRVLRFHAAGGLGQVSVARDSELNREVALKEIKPEYAAHAVARGRFVLEAEITGGLEHPSIVPVYGLGTYDDGRPFYAMRFIKGDTLKQAIDRYHDPERAKKTTDSERTLELRQLLGRFIDVCQAVEYAHSRGVLHRDLKPGNVMLGKYGETLVVDWGLAKARGAQDATDRNTSEMPLDPQSGSSIDPTEMGQRIGTLQYMSPEQCAGRLDQLGPATDIFALGATLYHLLTGKTVYHSATRDDLLACVASASFAPPRKVVRSVPKPLEAICLKALAEKPTNRYSSAQALLDDIEKYLADEPVWAYREPLAVRFRRWARKRPALVSGSLAAVAVTFLALVIGTFVLGEKNRELAEKEAIATAVKDFLLYDLLALANPEEQASAQDEQVKVDPDLRVQDLFVRAEAKITERFGKRPGVAAELRNLTTKSVPPELTIRALLVRASDKTLNRFVAQPLVEREILTTVGIGLLSIGESARSISHFERCRILSTSLFGAEHPATLASTNNLAGAYHDSGRLDESLALFQETLKLSEASLGQEHPCTLASMNSLAGIYQELGRLDEAISILKVRLSIRQIQFGQSHSSTLSAMNNLGTAYQSAGRYDEAISILRKVFDHRRSTLGETHPRTLTTAHNLANAMSSSGHAIDAIPIYEAIVKHQSNSIGNQHPHTLASMSDLAIAYRAIGQAGAAAALFEEVLISQNSFLDKGHPDILRTLNGLANSYVDLGKMDDATRIYKQLLTRSLEVLGPDHPLTMTSASNLALAYQSIGRFDESLALFETAVELTEANLGPEHPDTVRTYCGMAATLQSLKRFNDAEELLLISYQNANGLRLPLQISARAVIGENLVKLYTAWEKPAEAARWQKELEMLQGSAKE